MQDQVNPYVEVEIQRNLASWNTPMMHLSITTNVRNAALTIADARRIIDFAEANHQFKSLIRPILIVARKRKQKGEILGISKLECFMHRTTDSFFFRPPAQPNTRLR
jgi:hypothetical protein